MNKTVPQLWLEHLRVGEYWAHMRRVFETEVVSAIRAIYSRRQLFEVMTEFWHGHFNIYGWDWWTAPTMVQPDRDAIRPNVFGSFRTMLEAAAKTATMME